MSDGRLDNDTLAADLVVAELLTTAGLGDPYARVERLRALGRAVPSTLGVMVTGYDDCQHALRNPALVSDPDLSFAPLLGSSWRENRGITLLAESLLFLEGDAHNRVRKLVAGAFTPTAVASWQPTIVAIAERLLAEVSRRLDAGERVDLVESLARPLPIAVMAELLDLPHNDASRLRKMIGMIADLNVGLAMGEEELQKVHTIGVELDTYLRTALSRPASTQSSQVQRSGVLGRIALDPNEVVTEDDRVSLAFILLAAGFETTAMLVANAAALLIEHHDSWTKLSFDPSFAHAVVEETLRLQAPAALTARVTNAPTTVADVALVSGVTVTLMLSAANRDPARFVEPGSFRPDRYAGDPASRATAPISFGSGMHHCLGSVLARAEGVAVLERLCKLGGHAGLTIVEPITWRPSIALRGIESLIVMRTDLAPRSEPERTITPETSYVAGKRKRQGAQAALGLSIGGRFVASKLRRVFANADRKEELSEQFAAESSARAVEVMGDLKGVVMKTGQLLSFIGLGLPDVAQRSMAALQSDAPPLPAGVAETAVLRAFGKPVGELFAQWSPTPIAAASIGQVHRARLHDGREVAVKVQYPGVSEAIAADLKDQARVTKLISRFAMRSLDANNLSRELSARISEELDFRIEAKHQQDFADRYADHPFIRVPNIVTEMSNAVIMTSEWASGLRWQAFTTQATEDQKDRVGEIIARFIFGSTRRYLHFNADPNPGNYLVDPDGRFVTFLDFGLARRVAREHDHKLWLLVDSIMERRSANEVVAASIVGGYLFPDHGLEPELLTKYLFLTSDLYFNHPFTVTKEWVSEVGRKTFTFEGEFSVIRSKLSTEADFFLRDRVYWGMLGILSDLRATADWAPINNEYRIGAPPSTPMGEAEASWIRSRTKTSLSKPS